MKHLLSFLLLCSFSLGHLYAQKLDQSKVPAVVREAFRKKYPAVIGYTWQLNKAKTAFEAGFVANKKKYKAHFSPAGAWLKTEREIRASELPPAVIKAFKQTAYAAWRVKDIEEHETPGNPLSYRLEIRNGEKNADVRFLPDGKLLSVK